MAEQTAERAAAPPDEGQRQRRELNFGKKLAHTDKKVRDKAMKTVLKWITNHGGTLDDPMEHMKLWKSLWFAMWMSDKRPVQQELALTLALVMNSIPEERWTMWIGAFWETMQRSWENIDHHRMNKYLLLMRFVLAETMKYLRTRQWDLDLIEELNDVYLEVAPLTLDIVEGNGVALHFAAIWWEEFQPQAAELACPTDRLLALLEPFFRVVNEGRVALMVSQVHSKVMEGAPESLRPEVVRRLMDLSGSKEMAPGRRKEIHATVLRLKGESAAEPHPLLGLRRRPAEEPKWKERKKRKTK